MKLQRFVLCLLFFILVFETKAQTIQKQTQTTFVQLTDAHLFDDDESANFEALDWAVAKINSLKSKGTPIDFIVYTGDLGLRSVAIPSGSCEIAPLESSPQAGSRPLEQSIDRLAETLDQLKVRKMYFLPGNNDLVREQLGDIGRYYCFLSKLQTHLSDLAKKNNSLQKMEIVSLDARGSNFEGGIRLFGLNSASLKNQSEYQPWCSSSSKDDIPKLVSNECPQIQVERLSEILETGAPTALFTRIPYLKDPYPPRAKELPGAWDIPQTIRSEWEKAACDKNVIAIFSGHFHDSNREVYGARGRRTLQVNECVSNKIWIAPPLAQKYQQGQPMQARGLLVFTITPKEVTGCSIYWRSSESSASDDDVRPCQ